MRVGVCWGGSSAQVLPPLHPFPKAPAPSLPRPVPPPPTKHATPLLPPPPVPPNAAKQLISCRHWEGGEGLISGACRQAGGAGGSGRLVGVAPPCPPPLPLPREARGPSKRRARGGCPHSSYPRDSFAGYH